jgi:hypothetical protein
MEEKLIGYIFLGGIFILFYALNRAYKRKFSYLFIGIIFYLISSLLVVSFLEQKIDYSTSFAYTSLLFIPCLVYIFRYAHQKDLEEIYFGYSFGQINNEINNLNKLFSGEYPSIKSDLFHNIAKHQHGYKEIHSGFVIERDEKRLQVIFTGHSYKPKLQTIEQYNSEVAEQKKVEEKKKIELQKLEKAKQLEAIKKREWALHNSPLWNYFGAEKGGETTFYYLKLKNKKGQIRYKVGVSLNGVAKRYKGVSEKYEILFEEYLTHSNTIEKKILRHFQDKITNENLLGTNGTEIFREDVLRMDIDSF